VIVGNLFFLVVWIKNFARVVALTGNRKRFTGSDRERESEKKPMSLIWKTPENQRPCYREALSKHRSEDPRSFHELITEYLDAKMPAVRPPAESQVFVVAESGKLDE
jgi:hypothetical protein